MKFNESAAYALQRKILFRRRGQATVFLALLIPILFILAGVGFDIGWYYLNVSRLQNAADAAALAGASTLLNDTTNFADYSIESIRLVDNKFSALPEPDKDIDTATSDRVAADYARKNLSSDSAATPLKNAANATYAYTLVDNFSQNHSEITMTPRLCQDGDVFYYVVHLTEDIRHFFMPGGYDAMAAPVVAVAMLAKSADATVVFNARTLVLDANGGTLLDEENQSGTRRKVTENENTDTLLPTKATIQLKNYDSTFNEEFLFIGWNTKADGSGTTYGDGKSFTQAELNQLFGNGDTVVLYAQWERRNIYIAGDSLYNAMKGNSSYETKGLEELMTYNT